MKKLKALYIILQTDSLIMQGKCLSYRDEYQIDETDTDCDTVHCSSTTFGKSHQQHWAEQKCVAQSYLITCHTAMSLQEVFTWNWLWILETQSRFYSVFTKTYSGIVSPICLNLLINILIYLFCTRNGWITTTERN